jgi:hypothetical protein
MPVPRVERRIWTARRNGRATRDRRFRVRLTLLAARSVPPRRAIWASRSRRGCQLDIVTAGDPAAEGRDGSTTVLGGSRHACHQRLERPEPQNHRCATSSPRRTTRDRPLRGAWHAQESFWHYPFRRGWSRGGVAGMTGHPLAIPEIVLREYLGSYRRDVGAARATIVMESSDVSDRER